MPARKPFISERNRRKRLDFFSAFANWEIDKWKNVIWTDECKFKLYHSDGRVRVWRQKNERFLNECVKKTVKWEGGSVMVLACFCNDTLGPCYPITNTMNTSSYLESVLKPFYSSFYFNILGKQPNVLFQQDNTPPQVSLKTRSWFLAKNEVAPLACLLRVQT